jgi:hypothetical protein
VFTRIRVVVAQQRREIPPAVQDAPDVDLAGVVHVEDQVGRPLDRRGLGIFVPPHEEGNTRG